MSIVSNLKGNTNVSKHFSIYRYNLILFDKAWIPVEFLKQCEQQGITHLQLYYGDIWVEANVSVESLLLSLETDGLLYRGDRYCGKMLSFERPKIEWHFSVLPVEPGFKNELCWLCTSIDPVCDTLQTRCLDNLKNTLMDAPNASPQVLWERLLNMDPDDELIDPAEPCLDTFRLSVEIPKVIESLTQLGAIIFKYKQQSASLDSIKTLRYLATKGLFQFLVRPYHLFSILWWISIIFNHDKTLLGKMVEIIGMVLTEQFIKENTHLNMHARMRHLLTWLEMDSEFEILDAQHLPTSFNDFKTLLYSALYRNRSDKSNSCSSCDITGLIVASSKRIGIDVLSSMSTADSKNNKHHVNNSRFLLFGGRVYVTFLDFYRIILPNLVFRKIIAEKLHIFFIGARAKAVEMAVMKAIELSGRYDDFRSIWKKLHQFFDVPDKFGIVRKFPQCWNPRQDGIEWLRQYYITHSPHSFDSGLLWIKALKRMCFETIMLQTKFGRSGLPIGLEISAMTIPNTKVTFQGLQSLLLPEFATPPCIQMLLRMWIRDSHLKFLLRQTLIGYLLDLEHITFEHFDDFASEFTYLEKKRKNARKTAKPWFAKNKKSKTETEEQSNRWSRSCYHSNACVFQSSTEHMSSDQLKQNRIQWFPDIEDIISKETKLDCGAACLDWMVKHTGSEHRKDAIYEKRNEIDPRSAFYIHALLVLPDN